MQDLAPPPLVERQAEEEQPSGDDLVEADNAQGRRRQSRGAVRARSSL